MDFMKIVELLLLIYFPVLLKLLSVTIVSVIILQSFLYLAVMYLVVINNFTLVEVTVAVTLIKVKLIFFICAPFFLFLVILLILELFMSKHLSFLASSF